MAYGYQDRKYRVLRNLKEVEEMLKRTTTPQDIDVTKINDKLAEIARKVRIMANIEDV